MKKLALFALAFCSLVVNANDNDRWFKVVLNNDEMLLDMQTIKETKEGLIVWQKNTKQQCQKNDKKKLCYHVKRMYINCVYGTLRLLNSDTYTTKEDKYVSSSGSKVTETPAPNTFGEALLITSCEYKKSLVTESNEDGFNKFMRQMLGHY